MDTTPPSSPRRYPVHGAWHSPGSPPADPFAATAKANPGSHPDFSRDHYASPSHQAKVVPSPSSRHSSINEITSASLMRWSSAPASVVGSAPPTLLQAGSILMAVTEAAKDDGDEETFDCELAGSRKADRERIKSQSSVLLGTAFDMSSSGSRYAATMDDDDDCDWLPGQVDALPDGLDGLAIASTPPNRSSSLNLRRDLSLRHASQSTPSPPPQACASTALEVFEAAISEVCTGGLVHIDLSSIGNITHIPSTIADIRHATQIRLSSPNSLSPSSQPSFPQSARRTGLDRSKSTPTALMQPYRALMTSTSLKAPISIDLSNNPITSLPIELFSLHNLGLLSLRGCKLRAIPPSIDRLTQLRELNLSINQLSWLPAEILHLKQTVIRLAGNHWPDVPKELCEGATRRTASHLFLSLKQLERGNDDDDDDDDEHDAHGEGEGDGVPSLTELCQRRLFSFRHHLVSSDFRFGLHRYASRLLNEFADLEASTCPGCASRFFQSGQERYEWGKVGHQIVPIKWRGCRRGCLSGSRNPSPTLKTPVTAQRMGAC